MATVGTITLVATVDTIFIVILIAVKSQHVLKPRGRFE